MKMPDPALLADAIVAAIAANAAITSVIPADKITAYHGALDAIRSGRGVQAHPGMASVLPLVETPGMLVMVAAIGQATGPVYGNAALRFAVSVYYRTAEDALFDRVPRLLWNSPDGGTGLADFAEIVSPYTVQRMTVDRWPQWNRLTTNDGAELGLLSFGVYQEHFEC